MTKLNKADLTAEVLKRVRARKGCAGVSRVVLGETAEGRCNWEITLVDAVDAEDPRAVGPASSEVYDEMSSEFEMLTVQ